MDRKAASILFLVLAIFAPVLLSGQEVWLPFFVEDPRQSKTAFTNQEPIELTYTVRWMDGYEPIWDDLKPRAMSFGILELDPEFAEESDIRNERKFEKENFLDITYHLRYMGENKGEILIAGPKFAYRLAQSGDSQVLYFETPGFILAYGTVLTSDAEDIKEEFDLGSYQRAAMLWKVSAGITILVGIIGSFVLLFFKPAPAALSRENGGQEVVASIASKVLDPASVIRGLKDDIAKGNKGLVCNGLRDLLIVYVPGIGPGMTSKDMTTSVLSVSHEWERDRLLRVHTALRDIEDHLFVGGDEVNGKVKYHMSHLAATIHELGPWPVYWHRRLFNLKRRLVRPLYSLRRFTGRRP